MKYKKGDRVKVWSLQSWDDGGFLKGADAIVVQNQISDSVLLAVVRNRKGTYKLDKSYEVYPEQCVLVEATDKIEDDIQGFREATMDFERFCKTLIP